MPRVAGQIDLAKSEAILEAAAEVLSEQGLAAPIEAIARRAGVAKQTIYNHYGCKAELVRALVARRVGMITAPLIEPGAEEKPQETLEGFARSLLQALLQPRSTAIMRLSIQGASEMPDLARAVYEAGPRTTRAKLALFLAMETRAGRLAAPDPAQAAEFFAGMVMGSYQTAGLLGVPRQVSDAQVADIAREAAGRFMRAYAV
jgi:TetR/AcrR family transcriptional regulator, mexJK operon transcriptional repressor